MDISSRCASLMLLAGSLACSSVDAPTVTEPPEQPGSTSTGGVLVKTVTRGHDLDPDGYLIYVLRQSTSSIYTVKVGVNDSVLIKHSDAGWAERWLVRLADTQPNCWPGTPNPFDQYLAANQVTRIEYEIECLPLGTVVYDRISPHWAGTLQLHGSLSERYLIHHHGQFQLQYTSARFGVFEYPGRFDRSPTGVWRLYFGNGSTSSATMALAGDSLTVDYNDFILHSDFEPGVFVRRAAALGSR